MTDSQPASNKPTAKQLALLRKLANQRGETFATPRTKRQASVEIRRLSARPRDLHSDRRRESLEVSADMASRRGGDATVRSDELDGYGSTAQWSTDTRPLLSITNTEADGTLVDGTVQGDGAGPILKRFGFRWSPTLGRWQRPGKPADAFLTPLIAALRACTFEVELAIDR
jgi:hypothetical protein